MNRPTSVADALSRYDAALTRAAETQARLDNVLDLLIRAEKNNRRYAVELAEAHREIAELICQRAESENR